MEYAQVREWGEATLVTRVKLPPHTAAAGQGSYEPPSPASAPPPSTSASAAEDDVDADSRASASHGIIEVWSMVTAPCGKEPQASSDDDDDDDDDDDGLLFS
jgi:hypothetical protein